MYLIMNDKKYNLKLCNNLFSRFKGFMFKTKINSILCFPKCNSIHTFFMFKPIDVVMTDKDFNILFIYKKLKPYRIILPRKGVYYTFEFKVNKFNFNNTKRLVIQNN